MSEELRRKLGADEPIPVGCISVRYWVLRKRGDASAEPDWAYPDAESAAADRARLAPGELEAWEVVEVVRPLRDWVKEQYEP